MIVQGKGFTRDQIENKPAEADERFLEGPITTDNLMMYIGKKAINNYGCFGCHNVPGFETAKPIGAGLNDWGKKDPDRIAFEDSEHFIEHKYNVVDVRRNLTEQEKQAGATGWEFKDGKAPYEKFYAEQLDHGHQTRVGFLHLKLQEPRSYDYNRIVGWSERLRMPQFKFARPRRMSGESDADFEKRSTREDDEAREAVMTFILGLVAEPVPAKYINVPAGDKAALVNGRKVLDKFNCAGCHQVQPGIYDFKLTRDKVGEKDVEKDGKTVKEPVTARDLVLGKLEEMYGTVGVDPTEYRYPEHNCWAGPPQKDPNRVKAYGVIRPEGAFVNEDGDKFGPNEKYLMLRLMRALHFTNLTGVQRDIPAGTDLLMPREGMAGFVEQLGGDFAGRLTKYLQARDPATYAQQNENKSFAAGPPTLVNEGEKVQPAWLFQFLRNPIKIRPLTVLRMPRFNMSSDDAQALVNYFAATSHVTNPGIGLTYPYLAVPEREESHLAAAEAEYVTRLKKANDFDNRLKEMQPIWARVTKDRIADAESRLRAAKAQVDEAKKAKQDPAGAEKTVTDIEASLRKLLRGPGLQRLPRPAPRMGAARSLRFRCVQIGGQRAALPAMPPGRADSRQRAIRPATEPVGRAPPARLARLVAEQPAAVPAIQNHHAAQFSARLQGLRGPVPRFRQGFLQGPNQGGTRFPDDLSPGGRLAGPEGPAGHRNSRR